MSEKAPFFIGRSFYALKDSVKFSAAFMAMTESLVDNIGVFASDNLITWNKSLAWLRDEEFTRAFSEQATDPKERGAVWRTVILAWAARQALRVQGDFVECGCYRGTTASILNNMLELGNTGRQFFLYDVFDDARSSGALHAMAAHGPDLEEQVRARFVDAPHVVITRGRVPDSLTNAPAQIAFLHIDMNNVAAEMGALESLFDRVQPGGVIVFDDYGWTPYSRQMMSERAWLLERGYHVMELPTGQGVVIK